MNDFLFLDQYTTQAGSSWFVSCVCCVLGGKSDVIDITS